MKFAYTCHFQQIGINATKVEKTGIHFKTDVFAAVAVVDAKTIVKTRVTIVSYFGNVTASPFALTIVRKFTPR